MTQAAKKYYAGIMHEEIYFLSSKSSLSVSFMSSISRSPLNLYKTKVTHPSACAWLNCVKEEKIEVRREGERRGGRGREGVMRGRVFRWFTVTL